MLSTQEYHCFLQGVLPSEECFSWVDLRYDVGHYLVGSPAPNQEGKWLMLEDGIQIYFTASASGSEPHYHRSGDYWLIPAHTATGDVEWPEETEEQGRLKKDSDGRPIPKALPPHGVEHHFAPLAVGVRRVVNDARWTFSPLAQ